MVQHVNEITLSEKKKKHICMKRKSDMMTQVRHWRRPIACPSAALGLID